MRFNKANSEVARQVEEIAHTVAVQEEAALPNVRNGLAEVDKRIAESEES